MSTVAVTGSSGKLGRHVVAHLADHGHRVIALDRTPDPHSPAAAFVRVDLTDTGQVLEALTGVDDVHDGLDAVVHLAAIPAPGLTTNGATFANNIAATHNVFAAARRAGIRNVVWASSETVLGLPFGHRSDHDASGGNRSGHDAATPDSVHGDRPASDQDPPPYIPVDEEYPPRPNSTYSLVKTLEEEMARQFCRWVPELAMVGLRFSNVMDPDDYARFPGFDADPRSRSWNLWGYIDGRDGAQAVRRALEYCVAGHTGVEVFVIANADTVMSRPSAELAAEVFPDVPVTRPLGEHETLLSIDKARRVLGYAPQHSWRDAAPPSG
jgi:nucleoside-diphosphate-sugar epimerase